MSRDSWDWELDALCREVGVDFFPEDGEEEYTADRAAAMQVCGLCRVRERCLDAAMKRQEAFGIWGGTTPRQRLKMFRADDPDFRWPHSRPARIRRDQEGGEFPCGHEATPENSLAYTTANGYSTRRCRICKRDRERRREQERRAS